MATVSNTLLTLNPLGPLSTRESTTLTVTADLQFTTREVQAREPFEVRVDIWAFDWAGDPEPSDRPRMPKTWPDLLLYLQRPLFRFRPPYIGVWGPPRDFWSVRATASEVAFDATYTLRGSDVQKLNEDPGYSYWWPAYPITWERWDEVYAKVHLRNGVVSTDASAPVVVQTGRTVDIT